MMKEAWLGDEKTYLALFQLVFLCLMGYACMVHLQNPQILTGEAKQTFACFFGPSKGNRMHFFAMNSYFISL